MDPQLLTTYAPQMHFRRNTPLFEDYLNTMASLLGKDPRDLLAGVAEQLALLGDKPYSRYFMMPAEVLLYVLPLVRRSRADPEALVAFNGLSVEPFYRAFLAWNEVLVPGGSRPVYLHIERHGELRECPLLPRSILPLLSVQECEEVIGDDEWDEIEVMAATVDTELNEYLRRMGSVRDLRELRVRRATRGELINAIADAGIDDGFVYFHAMAQHTRFGDYCKTEELNAATAGLPVRDVVGWIGKRNETLSYPLSPGDMALLEEGLGKLGGSQGRLYGCERSGIHKYMITFGDIRKASQLKGAMNHKVRPLLNRILRNTSFARQLTDLSGRTRAVLFVDQTMTSGVSFLVWELVFRSFRADATGHWITITQHTEDSRNIALKYGLLDDVVTWGIWPQENNLEYYDGLFLDSGRGNVDSRYRLFQDVLDDLKAKPERWDPMGEAELSRGLAQLNSNIDEFVRSWSGPWAFVDDSQMLTCDRDLVKRQMIKALLRRDDPLEAAILQKYYMLCASVFEEDFIGWYMLRDGLRRLDTPEFLSAIPKHITTRDRELRRFDQSVFVSRIVEHATNRQQRQVGIMSDLLADTEFAKVVRQFLGGDISFECVEDGFYERYNPR